VSWTQTSARGKNTLERTLSVFAAVRPGEGTTALLLMVNVFILLTAYYLIKPVREALILSGAGAEIKSYAGAGQAILFLAIVPLYSAFANRVSRIRLINGVIAFFISNLVIFYLLGSMHFDLGVVFFLWVGLFSLMLVAQFWAFANDIYTEEEGKRLFAIVGIGSSLGAIFGAQAAGWLFEPIGPFPMMLVAAALLAVCMVLTNWIHVRESVSSLSGGAVSNRHALPVGTSGGFRLVFQSRYLLLIAVVVLLSNFVNTTGEFILGKTVAQHAKSTAGSEAYIGQFYAGFFFWVNLAGAGLQLFAVSRILKYIGVGASLLILPIVALSSYTVMAFAPILAYIRPLKIVENSVDYSIQNTTRHALFLNTSRDAKYKAQSAIESFFWRAGDALSAVLVFAGTQLAFSISQFAITNSFFVLVWLAVALAIMQVRKRERLKVTEQPAAA
jgi:ATP:ADP antiporter, AAA family